MDTTRHAADGVKAGPSRFSSRRSRKRKIHGLDEQFASCAAQLDSLSRLSERMKESMNRQAELLETIQNQLDLKAGL